MAKCVPGIYDLPSHDPQGTKNNLFPRKQSTSALQWAFYDPTPFENSQRWNGQNILPILLLNDDNMIEEH